jgi:hypothetical protein
MICRTLGAAPAPAPEGRGRRRTATTAPAPLAAHTGAALPVSGALEAAAGQLARRDGPRGERGDGGHRSLLGVLAVIVVGGLCLWAFTGLFSLAFHVGEFVAVAIAAGWVGYKLGHFRGRRAH